MNVIQSSIAVRKRTNQNTRTSQPPSGKRRQKLYQKQSRVPAKYISKFELAGLTSKQKEMVRQVIKKECDAF